MKRVYIESTESEKAHQELRRASAALKMPLFEAFLDLTVSRKGKVLLATRQRSHSWVRNAYNTLACQLMGIRASDATPNFGPSYINIKDTGGVIRSGNLIISLVIAINGDPEVGTQSYMDAAADAAFGIVVGTGVAAESFEDCALGTLIAHGNGAGQLAYTAMAAPAKSYDAPSKTKTIVHTRILNNNSGAGITVQEVGIYAKGSINATYTWLITRDLSVMLVPNAGQLTVAYTFNEIFPA